MGAKASKPVQTATRRFPSRPPGSAPAASARQPPPRPSVAAQAGAQAEAPGEDPSKKDPSKAARTAKDASIHADGQDPDFASFSQRLHKMGIANPNPTLSNSSTVASSGSYDANLNPTSQTSSSPSTNTAASPSYPTAPRNTTLNALQARASLQERAEAEFTDPSGGREFLDAARLRQLLIMQTVHKVPAREIEKRFGLKQGVVDRIGPVGVTTPALEGVVKQVWGGVIE
ncbi:hypothetical protein F5Y16DRAFT_255566 [Xylariaceae sp. FL0255]|nr:hypothetical protein F5Y16DRAFT_255566 [Xylariaceae sp. FL0255]